MGIRTWLLAAMALVMLTVCVLTWGSLGSAVLALCLVMMAASLAYQHFLTNRDEDGFQSGIDPRKQSRLRIPEAGFFTGRRTWKLGRNMLS